MKTILIKPVITEKAEDLVENKGQYTFIVHKNANKIEIAKAVEKRYGVVVKGVNTLIMPTKIKSRSTRSGIIKGRKPSYKKAVVSLMEGDTIDLYGDI